MDFSFILGGGGFDGHLLLTTSDLFFFSSYHSGVITDPTERETKRPLVDVSLFLSFLFSPPGFFSTIKNEPPPLYRRESGTPTKRGISGSGL